MSFAATAGTHSLSRRMIGIATAWILLLLVGGGLALDRVLVNAITSNFDSSLEYLVRAMIRSSEVGGDGEVRLTQPLGDQRFLEPYSGLYWQISGKGHDPFLSRSLWDRTLAPLPEPAQNKLVIRDSFQFSDEPLRVAEREVVLPGSPVVWRFSVAQSRASLDEQIGVVRWTLVRSFAVLGIGLIILAALQTLYGLWPLRRVGTAISAMRRGQQRRVTEALPVEVMPMVDELNALLEQNEQSAEEARQHAGNLAHALKTPLTVITNAATMGAPDLAETVKREAATMRRQVDHHLARARAVGRRGHIQARARTWDSINGVERAVSRLYPSVRFDADGDRECEVRVERQDLDEMLGNLIENAAKYGLGSVFATVRAVGSVVEIDVEDDGPGISVEDRLRLFDRGVRLDTTKPGTGLGLAIVRDVAEIYGGSIQLMESDDLGGLLARLTLPAAEKAFVTVPSTRA